MGSARVAPATSPYSPSSPNHRLTPPPHLTTSSRHGTRHTYPQTIQYLCALSSTAADTQADPVLSSSRAALVSLGELFKLRPEDTNVVTWTSTLTGLNARLEALHATAMTLNGDKGRSQAAVSDFASSAHSLYLDVDALGQAMLQDLKGRAGVDTQAEFEGKTKTEDESKLGEVVERLWPVRQKLEACRCISGNEQRRDGFCCAGRGGGGLSSAGAGPGQEQAV